MLTSTAQVTSKKTKLNIKCSDGTFAYIIVEGDMQTLITGDWLSVKCDGLLVGTYYKPICAVLDTENQ